MDRIDKLGEILDRFDELKRLLEEYSALSNRLVNADVEETAEASAIFADREALIGAMSEIKVGIDGLIEQQQPQKAALIRKMMNGDVTAGHFSDDERAIQGKVLDLRSLQSEILLKDERYRRRFQEKYDEIRDNLLELQKDKKKINFYNNAKLNSKGYIFDNQS